MRIQNESNRDQRERKFCIIFSLECKEFLDLGDFTFRLKTFQVTFSIKSFKFLWEIPTCDVRYVSPCRKDWWTQNIAISSKINMDSTSSNAAQSYTVQYNVYWDCLSNFSFRFYCNSGQKQQSTILYDDSQSSSKNIFTWSKFVFCKCIGKNYLSV